MRKSILPRSIRVYGIDLLKEDGGAGLMDRLIIQDYHAKDIPVLTNDKKMGKITGVERV